MNRYLLFAGRHDRPRGGWCDYVDALDHLEPALKVGEGLLRRNGGRQDWYHVVDARSLRTVARGGQHFPAPPRIDA